MPKQHKNQDMPKKTTRKPSKLGKPSKPPRVGRGCIEEEDGTRTDFPVYVYEMTPTEARIHSCRHKRRASSVRDAATAWGYAMDLMAPLFLHMKDACQEPPYTKGAVRTALARHADRIQQELRIDSLRDAEEETSESD